MTSHSQNLSDLTSSTLYHYRVKSKDAAGNLATSDDQTFTTQAPHVITGTISGTVSTSNAAISGATVTDGIRSAMTYINEIYSVTASGYQSSSLSGVTDGQTFTTSTPASGLIAFWKFDENTGTTAVDSSGNGNNGTISGATWVTGKVGNALSYDGVNDYVNGGNINIINAITIEAWVNPKVIKGKNRIIARKSSVYYFQINSNGRLEIYLYGTTNPGYHRMTSAIPLNTWTHVAVTYDGSKVLLYQNGTSQSFNDAGSLVSNSNPVRIGRDTGTSRQFNGLIDEVRIYNRSLSASEILADAGISDTTSPAISVLSSSNITSTSATVSWITNEVSDTQVEYGTTIGYGYSTTLNSTLITSHSQSLSGLTASTLYHYRVKSKDAAGNLATSGDQTFTTQDTPVITGTISGTVKNTSNAAISGATVTDGIRSAITDINGNYAISNIPSGTYSVTASASGYQSSNQSSVSVTAGQITTVNFNLSPSPDITPPVISVISSSNITSNSVIISWTTNEVSDSQVEYGTTASYGSSTTLNSTLITSHSQYLSGLTSSTLYHYRVKSRDAAGNLATSDDQTFTTSAPASGPVAFWKFDENTGTTAVDSSGNGNNGIISGATWVAGKVGNALSFDGVNDYVDGGNINQAYK